jgi:hypothetical protein
MDQGAVATVLPDLGSALAPGRDRPAGDPVADMGIWGMARVQEEVGRDRADREGPRPRGGRLDPRGRVPRLHPCPRRPSREVFPCELSASSSSSGKHGWNRPQISPREPSRPSRLGHTLKSRICPSHPPRRNHRTGLPRPRNRRRGTPVRRKTKLHQDLWLGIRPFPSHSVSGRALPGSPARYNSRDLRRSDGCPESAPYTPCRVSWPFVARQEGKQVPEQIIIALLRLWVCSGSLTVHRSVERVPLLAFCFASRSTTIPPGLPCQGRRRGARRLHKVMS